MPPRLRDALTRGFLIREEIAHAKVAKGGKGVGTGFWMFNFSPQLRDTLSRVTAVAGRAYARIFFTSFPF